MRYSPKKCPKCEAVYNEFDYHSCKEHRESLEKKVLEWKDKYYSLLAKYEARLKDTP